MKPSRFGFVVLVGLIFAAKLVVPQTAGLQLNASSYNMRSAFRAAGPDPQDLCQENVPKYAVTLTNHSSVAIVNVSHRGTITGGDPANGFLFETSSPCSSLAASASCTTLWSFFQFCAAACETQQFGILTYSGQYANTLQTVTASANVNGTTDRRVVMSCK